MNTYQNLHVFYSKTKTHNNDLLQAWTKFKRSVLFVTQVKNTYRDQS